MDDWESAPTVTSSNYQQEPPTFDQSSGGGRSFGKGRGLISSRNQDNNYDDGNRNEGWNGGGGGYSEEGDGRGSSGPRRGGRGGRGGDRSGNGDRNGGRFNRRDNDDSYDSGRSRGNNSWNNEKPNNWNGSNENDRNDEEWNSGRSGGNSRNSYDDNRDRRGGGRGGDRNFDGDGNDENGEEKEKRPPIYVPKERTEEELFEDAGISKGINFDDYKNISVKVTGDNPPPPISSFGEANLRALIMDNLKRTKYDDPTPIQKYAIPIILNGRDLMGTAQTGSGKTAAFLLPIIHSLLEKPSGESDGGAACQPNAIILSPTRELTTQIYEVARKFCTNSFLKVHQVYGGTSVGYQIKQLSNGCHILIATPGRLGDFVNRNVISFAAVKFVVLDEADRMLDMGFRSEIDKFLKHGDMPPSSSGRQTLMFSATFSQEIQRLAHTFLDDYVFLAVGIVGGACKDVEQEFIATSRKEKKKTLMELLASQEDIRGTLLFVETKRNADFVASYLSDSGHPTTSIHGDRFQPQREEALRDFKSRKMSILVATSVAARGLDIKGVKHVINYDLPDSVDEYVHRIGRTGRLGNKGRATSFYDSEQDRRIVDHLVQILKNAGQPIPDFLSADATGSSDYGQDQFGAYDYRSNKNSGDFKTNSSNIPTPIQDDEGW